MIRQREPAPRSCSLSLCFGTGCTGLFTGCKLSCLLEGCVCDTAVEVLHLRPRTAGRLTQGHVASGGLEQRQEAEPMAAQHTTEQVQGLVSASFDLNVVGDPLGSLVPCSVCGWRRCLTGRSPVIGCARPLCPSQADTRGLGAVLDGLCGKPL